MKSIAEINLRDLERVYLRSSDREEVERLLTRATMGNEQSQLEPWSPGSLEEFLAKSRVESHEFTERSALDRIMDFYAVCEIGVTIGFIPRALPEGFVRGAQRIIKHPFVRAYERNSAGVSMLVGRFASRVSDDGKEEKEDVQNGTAVSSFYEFLDISAPLRSRSVERLLYLSDNGVTTNPDVVKLLKTLASPSEYCRLLGYSEGRRDVLSERIQAIHDVVMTLRDLHEFRVRSWSSPRVISTFDAFHANRFRGRRFQRTEFFRAAIERLQEWGGGMRAVEVGAKKHRSIFDEALHGLSCYAGDLSQFCETSPEPDIETLRALEYAKPRMVGKVQPRAAPMLRPAEGGQEFRWARILAVGYEATEQDREALAGLFRAYQGPLRGQLRRWRVEEGEVEDMLQAFFLRLTEKPRLMKSVQLTGSLREYLRLALRRHVLNERRKRQSARRGSGQRIVSIETGGPGEKSLEVVDPKSMSSPDDRYLHEWALAVVRQTFEEVREEYAAKGQKRLFDTMIVHLGEERSHGERADLADRLGLTPNALKVARARLLMRLSERLRAVVARTVDDDGDVEEEIKYLMRVLSVNAGSQ